jgi:hypothetical protein
MLRLPLLVRLEEMNERRQAMVVQLKGVEKDLSGVQSITQQAHL